MERDGHGAEHTTRLVSQLQTVHWGPSQQVWMPFWDTDITLGILEF